MESEKPIDYVAKVVLMRSLQDLWQRLTAPHSTDEREAHLEYRTKLVSVTLSAITLVATPLSILTWRYGAYTLDEPIKTILLFVCSSIGWYLADRGGWRFSSFLLPIAVFLWALYGTLARGFDWTNVLHYVMAILLAIMLHSSRV